VICVRNTVGRVIHTLPEGEPVWGVTSLDDHIYVFHDKSSKEIEVYDLDSYRFLHCLKVPAGRGAVQDMVACGHNRCIYVSATSHIHRVPLDAGVITKWPVNDKSRFLSLTVTHNVLVTCPKSVR